MMTTSTVVFILENLKISFSVKSIVVRQKYLQRRFQEMLEMC